VLVCGVCDKSCGTSFVPLCSLVIGGSVRIGVDFYFEFLFEGLLLILLSALRAFCLLGDRQCCCFSVIFFFFIFFNLLVLACFLMIEVWTTSLILPCLVTVSIGDSK